jgi:hypothetical protein
VSGFNTSQSFWKHRVLKRVVRGQVFAYRCHHPKARIAFIDLHAGDGLGVALPQLNFLEERTSRSSSRILADLYREIGAAGLFLCEKDSERCSVLFEEIVPIVPAVTILDNNRRLLDVDFRHYDWALIISDPCGYKDHPIEVLQYIASQVICDVILTLNTGALQRLHGMKDDPVPGELKRVSAVRLAKQQYLWMEKLPEWPKTLRREQAARLINIVPQSPNYRFQIVVVADHFASCIDHKWEVYPARKGLRWAL